MGAPPPMSVLYDICFFHIHLDDLGYQKEAVMGSWMGERLKKEGIYVYFVAQW